MAAEDWQADHSVTAQQTDASATNAEMPADLASDDGPLEIPPRHPLLDSLLAEPRRYSFAQAVRLLHALFPNAPKIGHQGPPDDEAVRLRGTLTLSFASADISTVTETERPDGSLRYEISTTFLSVYGPNSPLPSYYTEDLIEQEEHGDSQLLCRFLDLFHHRLLSLFFRSWEKYRAVVQYAPTGTDYFSQRFMALLGIHPDGCPPGHAVDPTHLLAYAGLLAQQPRSEAALNGILNDFFDDLPIEIEPCVGQWMAVPDDQRNSLGAANCTLAHDFTLGSRVYDRSCTFGIAIGPLSAADFAAFLPPNQKMKQLREIIDLFNTDCLDYEVVLSLDPADVPPLRLSSETALLGWSTWLGHRTEPKTEVQFRISGWLHG